MARAELTLEAEGRVEELELQAAVEIQLLRIVQEALANVRKHSRAGRATVRLALEGDALAIEVEDDGLGFDPGLEARTGWPRFGLQTMRERAQAVGGSFEVESELGVGTRVRVAVPVMLPDEVALAPTAG
jgi:signal transduction histidine kinase